MFKYKQPSLRTSRGSRTPPCSSKAAASTAETADSDNDSVKSGTSNDESKEFKILFDVGDIPYVVGELSVLSTIIKEKLVKNAPVFKVWNTQASALGGIILARKKVEVVDQMKKKDLRSELVSIVSFTLCYQQVEVFDKFQAEIYDPSNDENDKDSWILFQVPTIMEDFDVTALEDIINRLDIDLPPSQSRCTGYLESVANAAKEETRVYALKFENMIFHNNKFQADDIEGKALTPYVTPSSKEGENFIHITYEIPIYGNDKLLKKGKKKTAMTPQEIARQMREMKLRGKGGFENMDESA